MEAAINDGEGMDDLMSDECEPKRMETLLEENKNLKHSLSLMQQQYRLLHSEFIKIRDSLGAVNNASDNAGTPRKIPRNYASSSISSARIGSTASDTNATAQGAANSTKNINTTSTSAQSSSVKNKKKIIHAINVNLNQINNHLKSKNCKNYTIKQNNKNAPVKISINNESDISNIKDNLINANISFHEYKWESEKKKSFIIKGLVGMEESELPNIKNQLIAAGLPDNISLSVFQTSYMKANTDRTHNTLILLTLPPGANLELINNIKHIDNIVVKFETLKNTKALQCKNCQRLGHSASGCQHAHRCVKCGVNHFKADCPRTTNKQVKLVCCNCSGEHTANNLKECAYAQKIINQSNTINNNSIHQNVNRSNNNLNNNNNKARTASVNRNHNLNLLNSTEFPKLGSSRTVVGINNKSASNSINPAYAQVLSNGCHHGQSTSGELKVVLEKLEMIMSIVLKHEQLFNRLVNYG